jgi:hypothetical protein
VQNTDRLQRIVSVVMKSGIYGLQIRDYSLQALGRKFKVNLLKARPCSQGSKAL